MFSSVLAFIFAFVDPGVPDPRAVAHSDVVPIEQASDDPVDRKSAWVFAEEPLAELVPQANLTVNTVTDLRLHRRARGRLAKSVVGMDLRQAVLDARNKSLSVHDGSSKAIPTPVPGTQRGFVRLGDGVDTLWREDDGLFYVSARINGAVVRLIVDTGASYTVLSPEDARRIGVDPRQITFAEHAETAAGGSRMARIVLANLEIGQNVAAGVPALVASGPLRTSLLGQNVLSRLASVTIEGDRMTLR